MSSKEEKHLERLSRKVSYVLRHCPEKDGVIRDNAGWVPVSNLLSLCKGLDRLTLELIVKTDDKTRYSFSADGRKIRANQGHSVEIDLGLPELAPPQYLYHGTATRFLESIFTSGLVAAKRHDVHLSSDYATAVKVGARHGTPVVLLVDAARMHASGMSFYRSDNGVWLTRQVPVGYFSICGSSPTA